jgi:starvation-inducible DNA-binding protein
MANKATLEGLQGLQADATVFYQKLRHYHWHVEGPHFFELHVKFEALYTHWAEVIDELAELVVTLDGKALPTLKDILARAHLKEDGEFPAPREMISRVAADVETFLEEARRVKSTAEKAGDEDTVTLLDDLMLAESKTLWMLRAFLK